MAITITLNEPEAEFVRHQLASGRYASTAEVVAEALRLLEEQQELEHHRALIEEGLEDVRAGRVSPEDDVYSRMEARIADAERDG